MPDLHSEWPSSTHDPFTLMTHNGTRLRKRSDHRMNKELLAEKIQSSDRMHTVTAVA